MNIAKNSRVRLHYDVTVTSYEDGWYFWYQWKEEIHNYTLVVNIRVQGFKNIENPGRGMQQPPSEDGLQKMAEEDEG